MADSQVNREDDVSDTRPVTRADLQFAFDALEKRIDDLKELVQPLVDRGKMTEQCLTAAVGLATKALAPATLWPLIILACLLIGGTPVAMMIVQRYLPAAPTIAVQHADDVHADAPAKVDP